MNKENVSIIPLGGVGDVTRNMYVYQYQDQILLVDCGLGFADETMLGVDLLIPDISYLLKSLSAGKKIVGMVITHGHEDHMGALPFILPQLPEFPIFGTPLTAAIANKKLQEFGMPRKVQSVSFADDHEIKLGVFSTQFIRVTHSVPDTSHIFIRTPAGNFYHGSDFKFDLSPYDGKKSDLAKIVRLSERGVTCLLSDCLGSERPGHTPSEKELTANFEQELRDCRGKFVVTTYSSNISRINQIIEIAEKLHKHVCFLGRSLISTVEVAKTLGLMKMQKGTEVRIDQLKNYKDNQMVYFIAGSQGQESSAMTRVATGEHRDVRLTPQDVVMFSSDPIPGNEVMINAVVDEISRSGAKVLYSTIADVHVSGHGAAQELMLLMELVKPQKLLPIGGTYKQMVAYKKLAKQIGFQDKDILLVEDGQEVIFEQEGPSRFGQKHPQRTVYVDEISGEELEHYVLRDRQKLSQDGVVVIIAEIDTQSGSIIGSPDIIIRGMGEKGAIEIKKTLLEEIQRTFSGKKGKVTNFAYLRQTMSEVVDKRLYKELRKRPLILPVLVEV